MRSPRIYSEECERAVLAAILLAPELVALVAAELEPDEFYIERHRLIFVAYLAIAERGDEIDLRSLQAELENSGVFETAGGIAYLAGLDNDLPSIDRWETYASTIKDRAGRRALVEMAQEVIYEAAGTDLPSMLAKVDSVARSVAEGNISSELRPVDRIVESTIVEMERIEEQGVQPGVATGFVSFDRQTGGLPDQALIVAAGRPGMGKSAWALQVARNVAGRAPVAYFSLEMTGEENVKRLFSVESFVPFQLIRDAQMSKDQWRSVHHAASKIEKLDLHIDESPSPGLHQVAAGCAKLQARRGPLGLVVVDYVGLMDAPAAERRELQVAGLSKGLKAIGKKFGCPVIMVSQLSRKCEERGDKRPMLSDLRESGSLEQDAHMVVFFYRPEYYQPDDIETKGLAEVIVAKHRNGRPGTVEMLFAGENVAFRDLERQ